MQKSLRFPWFHPPYHEDRETSGSPDGPLNLSHRHGFLKWKGRGGPNSASYNLFEQMATWCICGGNQWFSRFRPWIVNVNKKNYIFTYSLLSLYIHRRYWYVFVSILTISSGGFRGLRAVGRGRILSWMCWWIKTCQVYCIHRVASYVLDSYPAYPYNVLQCIQIKGIR